MRLHVVSIRSGSDAAKFIGSGFLIDGRHVLTAQHVWLDAVGPGGTAYVGVLPDSDRPLPATLTQAHVKRDAAILRIKDWDAPEGVQAPVLADDYTPLKGHHVELRAMSPTNGQVMISPNYSVSSYDNEWEEYELTPEVARGNSGGAIVHDGRVVGLVAKRAKDEPIARALALHSLVPWIASVIDAKAPAATVSLPDVAPVESAPGIDGLSHRLGSIHLHVDGVHARDFVEELVARQKVAGQAAELAWVVETRSGPQRAELPHVYDLHNPGADGRDALDYFSTTELHAGPDLPMPSQRRTIAFQVHEVLCELNNLEAEDVVVELERVVGCVDQRGEVALSPQLAMGGTIPSLETSLRLFAPYNKPSKVKPPGAAAYELHFSLDIPRGDSHRPPVALADLCEMVRLAGIELGGWFLFQDGRRWAYRSNGFVSSISAFALQSRWKRLRDQLDVDPNPVLRAARLRLLAEESLAVWRTPLVRVREGLRTVNELADWEQNLQDLKEFWVLLPNFLGDQDETVKLAMLGNLRRGVRYVYFLRSHADARRWLDFRAEMQKECDSAERLMVAYVVAFREGGACDRAPPAFIANPGSEGGEGYELVIDQPTNRVLYGIRLDDERLRTIVKAHSQAVGNADITDWHRVQATGSEQNITAVCANLLEEPSEALFSRIDSKLALLASQYDGTVAVYGYKSITVVFKGHPTALGHAVTFMSEGLAETQALQAMGEPFVLRFGLVLDAAQLTARACGMLWAGPAIRGSRKVLRCAPPRAGAFVGVDARGELPPFEAGTVKLQPIADGMYELVF